MPSRMRAAGTVCLLSSLVHGSVATTPVKLRGVWDTDLIKDTGIREHRYAAALETMIAEQHLQAGADAPEQWANESLSLAKAAWVESGAVH